jgi:hypothetical protein
MLTWGDQQIPEPMDEVVDIQVVFYDRAVGYVLYYLHVCVWSCQI